MFPHRRASRALVVTSALALTLGLAGCAAGTPTSSPENVARAFAEAMKANDIEGAAELVRPTLLTVDGDPATPVSNAVQAGAGTGVTGFEILDLVQDGESRAEAVVALTGGTVPQVSLSLERGGSDGEQWLVSWMEPRFAEVSLDVPPHWTAVVDGGEPIEGGDEDALLLMLPGTSLDGLGEWVDDEGYFEPVRLVSGDGNNDVRHFSFQATAEAVPTAKLEDTARTAVDESFTADIARVVGEVADAEAAGTARMVQAPTATAGGVGPHGSQSVSVDVDVFGGLVEVCRMTKEPWQVFGSGTPTLTRASLHPSLAEGESDTIAVPFAPYSTEPVTAAEFLFVPERPLSDCGG